MGDDVLAKGLKGFVVLFAASHVLDSMRRLRRGDSYFVSLTFWTLLLSVAALCSPAPMVTAAVAVNVLVCALYYAVVNRGHVTGQQFLLHGGVAIALLLLLARGSLPQMACRPCAAGVLALGFLLANALVQLWHERRCGQKVYPEAKFESPLWRLLLVPLLGGALAACMAKSGR